MKFQVILLAIGAELLSAQSDNFTDCTTPQLPRQENGKCIPIRSCALFNWKRHDIIHEEELTLLRSSHCGAVNGVYHVCCPLRHMRSSRNPTPTSDSYSRGMELLQGVPCGRFGTFRVANGQEAPLFAFPWMVLLKYNRGRPFRCGGSLISDRYVLTAAHCVEGYNGILTEVRLGEHNISSSEDCNRWLCAPPVEDVGIEKIILPEARKSGIHDDIALVRLNRTVEFKRHIRPVCLPITPELVGMTHSDYIVAGWGRTETDRRDEASDVLMMASVPYREHSVCSQAFNRGDLTKGHLCVGGENLTDSCQGDSGGPLIAFATYNGRHRMVQFGVVSFGVATCGQVDLPGVYTNVSNYMEWIASNMEA